MRPDVNNPIVPIFQQRGVMKLLRPLGITSLIACLVFFGACTESVIGPRHVIPGSGLRSVDAAETSPNMTSGTVSLGDLVLLGVYPQTTRIIVTTTGYSTVTVSGVVYRYGLGGHPSGAGGTVSLYGTFSTQAETVTDTLDFSGSMVLQQQAPSVFANAGDNAPWTWAGQASATVQRVDAQLAIQSVAHPGASTELALPFWGSSALLSPVTVPTGMRAAADTTSWVFIPDDGTASSPACNHFGATGLCVVVPTTSGTVHVKGYANAGPYVDAQPLHITVPAKPRIRIAAQPTTVSPGDTILVKTTFENAPDGNVYGYTYSIGAATGTCLTLFPARASCFLVPTSSGILRVKGRGADQIMFDSVAITVRTSLPPTLSVACPVSVIRGADVICTIGLSDATLPFAVTDISAGVQSGMDAFTISVTPPGPIAAGAVYRLSGPAVASTTLSVRGSAAWNGNVVGLAKTVNFAVERRPAELNEYVMTLGPKASGPGETAKFPSISAGREALGLYRRRAPRFDDIQIAIAGAGPNKGLSYVVSIPTIPASLVYVTLALSPGDPWYDAHPNKTGPLNDLGLPICTKSQIDNLRRETERHEGMTLADNSHYGIDQALLRKWRLGTTIESHVVGVVGSLEQVRQQMALDFETEWKAENAYLSSLQQAFDQTDTPKIFNGLGCSIYL